MDMMVEGKFYEHILDEHRRRIKKINAGEYIKTNDLGIAMKNV